MIPILCMPFFCVSVCVCVCVCVHACVHECVCACVVIFSGGLTTAMSFCCSRSKLGLGASAMCYIFKYLPYQLSEDQLSHFF